MEFFMTVYQVLIDEIDPTFPKEELEILINTRAKPSRIQFDNTSALVIFDSNEEAEKFLESFKNSNELNLDVKWAEPKNKKIKLREVQDSDDELETVINLLKKIATRRKSKSSSRFSLNSEDSYGHSSCSDNNYRKNYSNSNQLPDQACTREKSSGRNFRTSRNFERNADRLNDRMLIDASLFDNTRPLDLGQLCDIARKNDSFRRQENKNNFQIFKSRERNEGSFPNQNLNRRDSGRNDFQNMGQKNFGERNNFSQNKSMNPTNYGQNFGTENCDRNDLENGYIGQSNAVSDFGRKDNRRNCNQNRSRDMGQTNFGQTQDFSSGRNNFQNKPRGMGQASRNNFGTNRENNGRNDYQNNFRDQQPIENFHGRQGSSEHFQRSKSRDLVDGQTSQRSKSGNRNSFVNAQHFANVSSGRNDFQRSKSRDRLEVGGQNYSGSNFRKQKFVENDYQKNISKDKVLGQQNEEFSEKVIRLENLQNSQFEKVNDAGRQEVDTSFAKFESELNKSRDKAVSNKLKNNEVSKMEIQNMESVLNKIKDDKMDGVDWEKFIKVQKLVPNQLTEVLVVWTVSDKEGYVALADSYQETLSEIIAKMNRDEDDTFVPVFTKPLERLQVGQICASLYEGMSFRSIIETLSSTKISIRFIDFGNAIEHVGDIDEFSRKNLFEIYDKELLEDIPAQCIHVKLNDDGDVNDKLVQSDENIVRIKSISKANSIHLIEIENSSSNETTSASYDPPKHLEKINSDGNVNVSTNSFAQTFLLSKYFQQQTLPKNTFTKVTVQHVISNIEGFVTIINQNEEEEMIKIFEELYNNNYQYFNDTPINVGTLCAAKFTDDFWYRSIVTKKDANRTCVHFLDYGNQLELKGDVTKQLKKLECDWLKEMPAKAIRVILNESSNIQLECELPLVVKPVLIEDDVTIVETPDGFYARDKPSLYYLRQTAISHKNDNTNDIKETDVKIIDIKKNDMKTNGIKGNDIKTNDITNNNKTNDGNSKANNKKNKDNKIYELTNDEMEITTEVTNDDNNKENMLCNRGNNAFAHLEFKSGFRKIGLSDSESDFSQKSNTCRGGDLGVCSDIKKRLATAAKSAMIRNGSIVSVLKMINQSKIVLKLHENNLNERIDEIIRLNAKHSHLLWKPKKVAGETYFLCLLTTSNQSRALFFLVKSFIGQPMEGQNVLCISKKFTGEIYRGLIKKSINEDGLVKVCYLDRNNIEMLPIENLKMYLDCLCHIPPTIIRGYLANLTEDELSNSQTLYVKQVIDTNSKFKLVYTRRDGEMINDAILESTIDGIDSFNDKLIKLLSINSRGSQKLNNDEKSVSCLTTTETKKTLSRCEIYKSIQSIRQKCPLGKQDMIYMDCHNVENRTIFCSSINTELQIKSSEMLFELLSMVSISESDPKFRPKLGELCLAKSKDEYFRGLCINVSNDDNGSALICFIDWGDEHWINFNDIKPITPELATIEFNTAKCYIKGEIRPNWYVDIPSELNVNIISCTSNSDNDNIFYTYDVIVDEFLL